MSFAGRQNGSRQRFNFEGARIWGCAMLAVNPAPAIMRNQTNMVGMMALEEEEIRPRLTPVMLDRMGVSELERYIAELQAEIARASAQIAAKRDHRSAADSLFKF